MTGQRQRVKFLSMACLLVMLLSAALSIGAPASVYADSTAVGSNVMDDLRQDANFDAADYPSKINNYSLQVIQIAESSDRELLVYVYQPSGQDKGSRASSINIAEDEGLSLKNYKLEYINSDGVFFKYKVTGYEVADYKVRYYYIPSIFRPYIAGVDSNVAFENGISEVAFNVGKQYRFTGEGDAYSCDAIELETITVTDKFVGFVRYFDGYSLFGSGSCDSHFVAFDTDRPIDKLYEADVYYTKQNVIKEIDLPIYGGDTRVKYFDIKEDYAYLTYTDNVEHTGAGWWGAGTYTWDRIETVEQFLSETEVTQNLYSGAVFNVCVGNKITDEGKKALQNKKWVLRFAETSFSSSTAAATYRSESSTIVGDVTILRLKFEYDGVVYNLGVIDNKQSGSGKPINETEIKVDSKLWERLVNAVAKLFNISYEDAELLIIIVLAVVALAILMPILSLIFPPFGALLKLALKGIGLAIKYLFVGLWWIICLPFKGLKALIVKIKERRG